MGVIGVIPPMGDMGTEGATRLIRLGSMGVAASEKRSYATVGRGFLLFMCVYMGHGWFWFVLEGKRFGKVPDLSQSNFSKCFNINYQIYQ